MLHDLPALVRSVLETLLDRAEQPNRQTVVRVRLEPKQFPAYFATDTAAPRQTANRALQQLADAGIVRLHWEKHEAGNWLNAVDLVTERVADAYIGVGRVPRHIQEAQLAQLLDVQSALPGWHAGFIGWAQTQLQSKGSRVRSLGPLELGNDRWNRDVLRALHAIAALQAPTLERTLSVRLFSNSKRLEELRGAVVKVLRRHDPYAADYDDDESALLRAHWLHRVPEYVPLAGPITLQYDDATLDLAQFKPSVALSASMLQRATITACSACAVVSVENATSFSELVVLQVPHVFAIFTGGFASPTVISLLRSIHSLVPEVPLLHWGDLDAGGLRILAHLRASVGYVLPLAMNKAILDEHQQFTQPLTSNDYQSLVTLRRNELLNDCLTLIDHVLNTRKKLEQEAVSAEMVAALLQAARLP